MTKTYLLFIETKFNYTFRRPLRRVDMIKGKKQSFGLFDQSKHG